jgi:glycosyltransferase involved in cell wall biosynthesis
VIGGLHQFVPTFEPGAVGNHTLELQRLIREMGLESEVFAEHIRAPFEGRATPYGRFGGRRAKHSPGSALIYQSAIGSWVAQFLMGRDEPLVVNYHNITPAEFFAPWEPDAVHGITWGRNQLRELADRAVLGVADSRFNELELEEIGYAETAVAPVLFDLDALDVAVDRGVLADLDAEKRDGGADLLFVGRVAPHKSQHDLIRALAVYRAVYDPHARLRLVGGPGDGKYVDALRALAAELELGDAVRLTGPVSPGALAAYYKAADAFVCLSEHEGFCVPLIEAMHNEVPIIAYAAAAVPETLGPAGILLADKEPALVAGAIHRVVSDGSVRDGLVAAGRERLPSFSLASARARFRGVLERLLKELA